MFCKECGSTITVTDRFCPACGTPNVNCKFQPKFGPALKTVEPRIMFEPAPAGAPSCPRCHRLIERPQEYCRGCGMDLVAAWERFDRVHVLDAWRQRWDTVEYRSSRRIAFLLRGILTVGVGVATAVGLSEFWLYTRAGGGLLEGPATSDIRRGLDVVTGIAVSLFAVGVVLTLVWMRRTYENLSALAVGDLRFKSAWAVGGWFVPGFNFYRPKQIMDDLWKGSHPLAPPFSSSWRVGPPPVWSMVWWASLLLASFFGLFSHFAEPSGVNGDLRLSLATAGWAGLLFAASAVTLQRLVREITDRQDARAGFVLDADREPGADDIVLAGDATSKPSGADPDPEVERFDDAPSLLRSGTDESVYGKY
jgi:RNA polymerase subunit RPABC4/transcription elongation factor Spt4